MRCFSNSLESRLLVDLLSVASLVANGCVLDSATWYDFFANIPFPLSRKVSSSHVVIWMGKSLDYPRVKRQSTASNLHIWGLGMRSLSVRAREASLMIKEAGSQVVDLDTKGTETEPWIQTEISGHSDLDSRTHVGRRPISWFLRWLDLPDVDWKRIVC